MSKAKQIDKIIAPMMTEKGFELETDRRTYWRWKKMVSDVQEEVLIFDMQQLIQLTIGKSMNGVHFVLGDELLDTLDHPRTESDDWDYRGCEKERKKELYENILYDMRDILEKNCDRILVEHAEAVKKALPNRKHFEKLRDHYDKMAEEYSQKYATQDKDMLEIFEIMMHEISGMSEKRIEEVEDELLGFAALMYSETLKRYGGIKTVYEEYENIMLTKVGKTKMMY